MTTPKYQCSCGAPADIFVQPRGIGGWPAPAYAACFDHAADAIRYVRDKAPTLSMTVKIVTGAVEPEVTVWAARRRIGLDYHRIADPAALIGASPTACGRSTASATSIFLPIRSAAGSGLKPCPRCYPPA